jgi:hypothetical protein
MPSLQGRIGRLYTDLQAFPDASEASKSVVGVYNTLLVLAQKERQEDAVLSKMAEVTGTIDAPSLRALVGQILAAFQQ